ncbi:MULTISPECIES: hypothetical protein [unclassified Carboxylicivirga]|uniref:hypothetical protein n=1 Tax=Carboxylicivirga TaxID=1628153 RepID=UPI003D34CFAF
MQNELVGYSRAGDIFHYRWAARRCLNLIYPNTSLIDVVIEGSKESEKKGEYVIDVSEYYSDCVKYYQLKHTTVQKDIPFTLSDLQGTLEGFSERYSQHRKNKNKLNSSFVIVTNRPISSSFKKNIQLLADKEQVNNRFKKTLEKYTKLTDHRLALFCSVLQLDDSEGDYNIQKNELRTEISQLITGAVDNAQLESIVSLVSEKVLPHSNGLICKEDILKRFKISSEKDLFPAPPIWEKAENIIEIEQYGNLKQNVLSSINPVIIHAPGGVGKSVFCRQLINSLPSNSAGIAYDCFGAGRYRNRSESRHRHRDALVQIVNELAVKGLCDPLLVQDTSLDSDIMKKFLLRIECSVKALRKVQDSASLFILIDAADNAEMAAQEFSHPCFANELLREHIPDGCKLVLLCRTERIHLLKPPSSISQFGLKPFTKDESHLNLKRKFPKANEQDGLEFHRLTSGNPRVQANALDIKASTVSELLEQIGPSGMTVEDQIELQLNTAVSRLKDSLSDIFQKQVNAICLGLASLPPHIPIKILAKASGVSIAEIKSFVSDIGRSLWLSDESVQFRDEPTETWFRKTYLATKGNFETYISILEPLAEQSTYISEVLPHLYLQAEQYDKLISIALSDDYLPEDNPIDERNVRVYRLQFAFRAALREKKYEDAIKIALRSGEEVAGNQRQLSLFQDNIDLLVLLQDKQKVQEIAFKRLLSSSWNGSENVYTASLLSGIKEFKGEARGYLRAAVNWMQIFYEERRNSEEQFHQINIEDGDILEIAYAYLNIHGVNDCIAFLNRFTSKGYIFGIVRSLIRRLVDIGSFEKINTFLKTCTKEPYYTVAIVSELVVIGKYPQKEYIENCLQLLNNSKSRIKKVGYYEHNDIITPAIVAFIEACLFRGLPTTQMLNVLKYYIPERATQTVYSGYQHHERTVYLKSLAIQTLLQNRNEVNFDEIIPENLLAKENKKNNRQDDDIKEFKEIINGLFPWYFLKAKLLSNQKIDFEDAIKVANDKSNSARSNRYRQNDTLPYEIASLNSSILLLINDKGINEINGFYHSYIKGNKHLWISNHIGLVRASFRLSHLSHIKHELEQDAYKRIKSIKDDGPEEIAERYISLTRAVLNEATDDASVYFEEAIDIVSKFGDEIVRRWEAVVAIAKQASIGKDINEELAYRFIRCAEVVGEYVAREKYWNRSEAISICTRMSDGAGISALSRWRDRDIGRFEYQLEALLTELIKSSKISSSVCWSLARFFSYHNLPGLLKICLQQENDSKVKQAIFADAVYLLQIEGASHGCWKEMQQMAIEQNIKNNNVESILHSHQSNVVTSLKSKNHKRSSNSNDTESKINWEDIFGTSNILNNEEFENCFQRFNIESKKQHYRSVDTFFKKCLSRINETDYWKFIDILFLSDLNRFEIKSLFDSLPKNWVSKVSFKKKWPDIIKRLGSKFSHELVTLYGFKYFIEDFKLHGHEVNILKEGIFEGLANGYEFSNAEMFFGFPCVVVPLIKPEQSTELLDYALTRFELHIESDFGDGEWSDWLSTSHNTNKSIAGFIWSALGSPRSSERWNAAHSVRMLSKFGCTEIIDELIQWMQLNKVEAFGNIKFPFYNLHAKQFLLIALARVALDQPELLITYKDIFIQNALEEEHIIIQKKSAEIAICIANSGKSDFDNSVLEKLNEIGVSKMPIDEIAYNENKDSYWHQNNEVSTEYEFHFGWDFDRYWYEPLGNVFGIPGKQVEDIAAHVIINEWGIKDKSGYNNDPRVSIWNRYSQERETWHDHGNYPRTDNLDFYLSYHSMLVAASKLLKKMPVVSKRDWYDDEWGEWLNRHFLTCDNGKWLSDYRGSVPIKRPQWIFLNKNKDWRTNILEQDYLDALLIEKDGEQWLNVRGGWEEVEGEHDETISITSALVSKESAHALMRALETCSDPYDYKLPDYEEGNMEINSTPFVLIGWITDKSVSVRIDEYDPYADNLSYPSYSIGSDIINKTGLTVKDDGTVCFPEETNSILVSEVWSSHRDTISEEPNQAGNRLQISLRFLKHLCLEYNCYLIIEVEIKREISYKYRERDEKYEYSKPKQKLFLLSSDGELKTTRANYKLG